MDRGTAYTDAERARLGLEGLLPPRVETLGEQAERVLANLRALGDPLVRYAYLDTVRAASETLFFRVLLDNLEELLPVVYTPTVGRACQAWSRIYTRPQGLYIAARHAGRVESLLQNRAVRGNAAHGGPRRDVGVIVVTDGGRILGLGDLGANGMGIPIGKLALYTACAGVPPGRCLPVTLDVGTDNATLREDPLYLGERMARLSGERWDALLEEFMAAAQAVFPEAIVQFEDFNNAAAFRLLARYRERYRCFNDDVQGTGAMGLAGLLAAARVTGRPLAQQRVLFAGAGEAALGIGATLVAALRRVGLSATEARERCLYFDSKGLVVAAREGLGAHKRAFALEAPPLSDLRAAIEAHRPTVLVGASGCGGLFDAGVLAAMARVNERPIVFALSNPTANAECSAEEACAATQGRAVFASGSPFAPVMLAGRVHRPGQANNSFVFPGVGLGLLLSGAMRVSDAMFIAAADALAAQVSEAELAEGCVFPRAARLREVAARVAAAVAAVAHDEGLATCARPADLHAAARVAMYEPAYPA